MRASAYPTLDSEPAKRLVWAVALPDGRVCQVAQMWEPRDPEVWYYYGGARPLGAREAPELIRACGGEGRAVSRVEELGGGVYRIEARLQPGPGGANPQ